VNHPVRAALAAIATAFLILVSGTGPALSEGFALGYHATENP